jgi:hypothetical protein
MHVQPRSSHLSDCSTHRRPVSGSAKTAAVWHCCLGMDRASMTVSQHSRACASGFERARGRLDMRGPQTAIEPVIFLKCRRMASGVAWRDSKGSGAEVGLSGLRRCRKCPGASTGCSSRGTPLSAHGESGFLSCAPGFGTRQNGLCWTQSERRGVRGRNKRR